MYVFMLHIHIHVHIYVQDSSEWFLRGARCWRGEACPAGVVCLREGAEGRCKVCGATVDDEYIARGRGAEGEGRRLLEAAVAARGAASDEVVARMQEWLRTGAGRILHAWHPVRGEIQDLLSHVLVSHAQGAFRPLSLFIYTIVCVCVCVCIYIYMSRAEGAQGRGRRALLRQALDLAVGASTGVTNRLAALPLTNVRPHVDPEADPSSACPHVSVVDLGPVLCLCVLG